MTLAGGQRFNQRELCCCVCLHKAASSKGDPGTHGYFCCRVSALLGVMSWDVRLSWACSSSLGLYTALGVLTLQEMAALCGGNTTTARKKIISQHSVLVGALGWQQCGCVWVLELPHGLTAIHGSTSWVNLASKKFPPEFYFRKN